MEIKPEQVTVPRAEWEALKRQADILTNLQHQGRIGWWKVDFDERTFNCSRMVADLLELDRLPVSFEVFRAHIHPDHRERVIRNFSLYEQVGFYEERFPLRTRVGYSWIHTKLGNKEVGENGHRVAQGFMQYMDEQEADRNERDVSRGRLTELLARHNMLSRSLLTLLQYPDEQDVINEILRSLLLQFDGDRVYIFEYDDEQRTHSCRYEVTAPGIDPEIDRLQNISVDDSKWWTRQVTQSLPIILNDLAQLPPEAQQTRELLAMQGIKSLLVVPLVSSRGVIGYIGIDMVRHAQVWNEVDQQWFFSVANILSVCLELKRSEINLNREKEYFRGLYLYMPLGYARIRIVYDAQGRPSDYRLMDINPAFEQITYFPRGRVIGKSLHDPRFLLSEEILDALDEVALKGRVISNKQMKLRNGRYFNVILFPSDEGHCTALFTDVTDFSRAQQALQQSEAMLQSIYNGIPVGIEVYDKDGYLMDINAEDMRIFGLDYKEQVLGVNLFENPNILPEEKEALRNKRDVEFTLDYDFDRVAHAGYYSSHQHSGVKHVQVRSSIIYDDRHNVERYVLIVEDQTESQRMNLRLSDVEFRFNYMAEAAQIGLCRWDTVRRVFSASDQWYANVGLAAPVSDVFEAYVNVHPEDYERLHDFLLKAAEGKADLYRDEIRVRDGLNWKWIRCNYRVRQGGLQENDVEVIGLNIDITELKETEIRLNEARLRAEQSDRLKSAFVANMSHEIRTPLNAIVGFSSLLMEDGDAQDKQEYMAIIQRNNEQLLQLISDILDLSKIEAGMIDVSPECFDVGELCRNLVDSYRSSQGVPVRLREGLPACSLFSDRSKLIQVLSNFVNNALKFTSQGMIEVGYEVRSSLIEFYVSDTGIGIAPENLPSVFNRFEKINNFAQGTGLGLAICRSIVEKLGGRIGVDSRPGEGSRFWFVLPLDVPEEASDAPEETAGAARAAAVGEPDAAPEPATPQLQDGVAGGPAEAGGSEGESCEQEVPGPEPADRPVRERPLVLVAEDTESNYMVLSAVLRKEYDLLRARNGKEAVELFFRESPDLVLMDMKMPEMDGLEATAEIRKRDRQTPVIVVTAFAFPDDKRRAQEAGCNDYLTKPVDFEQLKATLTRWLNR